MVTVGTRGSTTSPTVRESVLLVITGGFFWLGSPESKGVPGGTVIGFVDGGFRGREVVVPTYP